MKIAKYILAASAFFGCNEKEAMYVDLGSQCNNGIETIYYYDINHGDPMMNFLSGRTACDYDEVGRVISEKYYDSINFDAKITVETSFYWSEGTVMVEVKDYMYGDHEKDFVSSRRVVQMM